MKHALAIAAAILLTASAARAQDVWGWSIIIPSVTGADQLGLTLREQMARTPSAPKAAPAAPASPPSAEALNFQPSPERRAANFARFIAQRRGGDPAAVKQLEALLNSPQLMPQLESELRKRDLRVNNVADAYAIWWIQSWQTVHGQTADPSPATIRGVKAQSEHAFLASPALLGASDATKQEFAEGLLVQAAILGSALEQVKGDPAQVRALGNVARQTARQVGLDLDSMRLTETGFTLTGG